MHSKINSQLKLSIYSVGSRVALELSVDEAFIRMAIFFSAEAQNQQPTGNTKLRSVWSAGIRMMDSIWCSHTCKLYINIYIYVQYMCVCVSLHCTYIVGAKMMNQMFSFSLKSKSKMLTGSY